MDLSSASTRFTACRSHFSTPITVVYGCKRHCISIYRLGGPRARCWAASTLPEVTTPPALPEAASAPVPAAQARAAYMAAPENDLLSKAPRSVQNFFRSTEFFGRVGTIYGAYKLTQLKTALLKLQGKSSQDVAVQKLWDDQHTWAGEQMYDLCISLRGFYLKAGQFIGARADFVPEQICRKLCLLQDQVPPMSAERARQVVCSELGISDLSEVFEWIDLDKPIGSASISQVHKAQLRRFRSQQLQRLARRERGLMMQLTVSAGDTAWSICNSHGISLAELHAANKHVDLDSLQPGQQVKVPVVLGLEHFQNIDSSSSSRVSNSSDGSKYASSHTSSGTGNDNTIGFNRNSPAKSSKQKTSADSSCHSSSSSSSSSEDEPEHSSSSSSSSEGGWHLEPGSSYRAAGFELGKKGHLLQLMMQSRGNGADSSFSRTLLGASSSEEPADTTSMGSTAGTGAGADLPDVHSPAAAAVAHAAASGTIPGGGLVAVKIQYPGALQTMTLDLVNLRATSAFLQKTELKFDLLSAVEEMQRQIHLEFDFMREARVMDTIAQHLSAMSSAISVPRSVPGLVSQRLMVMTFMEGLPLLQLRDKVAHLPKWKREKAAKRILARVSEAYGLMILGEGLFQADGHPGNILVQPGGRVALLDYGQSKQLGEKDKRAFADLIVAMNRGDRRAISDALDCLEVATSKDDINLRSDMAYGMFDTRGKVDPFDQNSPIKQAAIEKFPPDMFFVLRVVQLLRGMANGMGIDDFSTADQWAPLARQTINKAKKKDKKRQQRQRLQRRIQAQPVYDLAAYVCPLKLTV